MKNYLIFFLKYYLPALAVAGVIFFFSSIPSLQYSMHSTAEEIVLRKAAHFVEFAILSFFLWRLIYAGHKFSARYAFFWAFVLAALYGASDEFHQTFVVGRTGKVIDAFLDAFSALFILELLVIFVRKKMTWKNFSILLLALAVLVGLELKMISETKSFKVSFTRIKKDLKYTIKDEWAYIQKMKNGLYEKNNNENSGGVMVDDSSKNEEIAKVEEMPMENVSATEVESKEIIIPDEISIAVPFTSQAPLAQWDELHEESCEETSLVMLKYYLDGKTLTPKIAEKEIQALVAFQMKNYGDYKDTTAAETVKLAQDFYGIQNLRVVYDFTEADLKKYLAQKKPIIVPAAGRLLGNPNFTPPGPLYHNLILTGYEENEIITNDPGTRKGEKYRYDADILYEAIHDFPGNADDIEKGRKAMIVLE